MLDALSQTYERDGFAFPVDVVSASEAQEIRNDLELAELDLAGDPENSCCCAPTPTGYFRLSTG